MPEINQKTFEDVNVSKNDDRHSVYASNPHIISTSASCSAISC